MVASRIRCIVVEIPALAERVEQRVRPPARELLPWADPYIAGLIRKLQNEVRQERAAQREEMMRQLAERTERHGLQAEAPPPGNAPIEFELPGDEDWPLLRDVPTDGNSSR